MKITDDLRTTLRDAGLSEDEVLLKTGDELREAIGGEALHRLAVELAKEGQGITPYVGSPGQLAQADLIERNLEVLRLRVVERMTYEAIGAEVGLSRSRVRVLLHDYFGVHHTPRLSAPTAIVPDIGSVQRSVVFQLLRDDRDEMWRFGELHKEIPNITADLLRKAIKLLDEGKAIGVLRHICWVTDGIRYLDSLEMICI